MLRKRLAAERKRAEQERRRRSAEWWVEHVAVDEDMIRIASIMRAHELPPVTWFGLVALSVQLRSDERFSDDVVEQYAPGYEALEREICEAYAHLETSEEIWETPEMQALSKVWDAAKDQFTADLFTCYGFPELGELFVRDFEEFDRRDHESRRYLSGPLHHHAVHGPCRLGEERHGVVIRIEPDGSYELPDMLPEFSVEEMARA